MRRLVLTLLCFLETCSFVSKADSIGINFVGGSTVNGMPAPLGANETAGFVPQQFWNNAPGASGTIALQGDAGASLPAFYPDFSAMWSSAFGIRSTPITETSANSRLMKGYLNSDDTLSGKIMVTISDIPPGFTAGGYAVIVYFDGDNRSANRVGRYTARALNYGSRTIYGLDGSNVDFAGSFKQVPSSRTTDQGGATPDGNFIIFTGLHDENFTLEVNGTSADDLNSRAALNAIQIVDQRSLPAPPGPVITST